MNPSLSRPPRCPLSTSRAPVSVDQVATATGGTTVTGRVHRSLAPRGVHGAMAAHRRGRRPGGVHVPLRRRHPQSSDSPHRTHPGRGHRGRPSGGSGCCSPGFALALGGAVGSRITDGAPTAFQPAAGASRDRLGAWAGLVAAAGLGAAAGRPGRLGRPGQLRAGQGAAGRGGGVRGRPGSDEGSGLAHPAPTSSGGTRVT
jgi:hypothetical protein